MKNRFERLWLFLITIAFLLVGGFIVYLTLNRISSVNTCSYGGKTFKVGQEILGYKQGSKCMCEGGQIVCTSVDLGSTSPSLEIFVRDNLKMSLKYLSAGTKDILSSLPLKTRFVDFSVKEKTLDVTIEQEQLCTDDLRLPVQIGMYYYNDGKLYITNVINKSPDLYSISCIAQVNYSISNWSGNLDNLSIVYVNEEGQEYKAALCSYNGKVYAQGDVYSAVDGCNICTCNNSVSKCTNDRQCPILK